MKSLTLAAIAALTLAATPVLAAPCNTGNTGKQAAATDKSSNADGGTKNEASDKKMSPGTVGAMNNVGANQGLGSDKGGAGAAENSTTKNMAGGDQPSSPATVGAMNNAGANQGLGKEGKTGDDC